MAFISTYETPIVGTLTLASDGDLLTGCWFDIERRPAWPATEERIRRDGLPVFDLVRDWFDRYFAGEAPDPRELPLGAMATAFQSRVREAMLAIPYGETTTYGAIARRIEAETGQRSSARAVGGAVGRNPLCIIVPCHRVIGANGSLTGFGGGLDRKVALLAHEGVLGL